MLVTAVSIFACCPNCSDPSGRGKIGRPIALIAMLREIKPDIVHTHSSKAGILGRAAAAKLGIPAVHTIHGASFHYGQNPIAHELYRLAEKWPLAAARNSISVCDAMTDQYVAAGIAPRENFVTIYSGMEVEPFLSPSISRGRAAGTRTATERRRHRQDRTFVSSQRPRVRHRCRPAVVARNPNAKFLLVGDGVLALSLKSTSLTSGSAGTSSSPVSSRQAASLN